MKIELKPYEKAGRVVRLLAWLSIFMVIAVIGILVAILVPMFKDPAGFRILPVLGAIGILAAVCLFTYFQFVLGTALKQHKDWARKWGIGYAVLQLFNFPIGTITGGYILWCLIKGWNQ